MKRQPSIEMIIWYGWTMQEITETKIQNNMKYQNFMCPYELALKLHELGVNSESEFYFVKEMKGGGTQIDSVVQNTMRYSYRKEGDLIPAYMSHELGEILPSMINVSKSKIWDDWLQLTQYFPNKDSEYYETAYVRYDVYDSQTEVYSGFGDTEVESRAMLLIDLLDKKVLTLSDLNLNQIRWEITEIKQIYNYIPKLNR